MFRVLVFFLILFIVTPASSIFSQEDQRKIEYSDDEFSDEQELSELDEEPEAKKQREDFWFSFSGDTALYSVMGFAYGGSFSIGYGTGSSVGLKVAYIYDMESVGIIELNFLLRFYFLRPKPAKPSRTGYQGPFIQLMGGPVIFNRFKNFSIPPDSGMISGGLCAGWRFLFADKFFIEPSVRGGYPYLFGAAIAAGFRF